MTYSISEKHFVMFFLSSRQIWQLTCDGTANLSTTRTNTGAVPHHPVLRSLIGFTDLVCPVIVLIITGLLH